MPIVIIQHPLFCFPLDVMKLLFHGYCVTLYFFVRKFAYFYFCLKFQFGHPWSNYNFRLLKQQTRILSILVMKKKKEFIHCVKLKTQRSKNMLKNFKQKNLLSIWVFFFSSNTRTIFLILFLSDISHGFRLSFVPCLTNVCRATVQIVKRTYTLYILWFPISTIFAWYIHILCHKYDNF